MLGRASYPMDYVGAVHARIGKQLKTLDKAKASEAMVQDALCNMVLAMELSFVHRLRKQEGKDGNPLNELRMLANSLMEHNGVMTEDSTIKYDTRKSITGLAIGDKIVIDREAFERLADAVAEEIAAKYR